MKLSVLVVLFLVSPLLFAKSPNINKLNKIIAEQINENEPGCSVGVFEKGKILLAKGYGLSNLELNIPMANNNVHRMASVSKQFVAMATLLLADQGKINIANDIRDYIEGLPDYPFKVSINSIINHTAGMGDYDMISAYGAPEDYNIPKGALNLKAVSGHPFRIGNEDYLTVEEFHSLVKKLPLLHKPDTKWQYSNMGYVLLAILIEEVSGKTLREFSHEHIFMPLNMRNTFFADDPTEIVKNRAYGYAKDESGTYINSMTNLFWVGDGGLHTNIEDMQKWDKQFYHPVLGEKPSQLIKLFMRPNSMIPVNPEQGGDVFYANGQGISKNEYGSRISHSGGWLGANIRYTRYPDTQFSNVVMCSNTSLNSSEISKSISDWYFKSR